MERLEYESDWEPPFRMMGRLVLNSIVQSLKELIERDMVEQDEIVDRLRNEGF